MNTARQVSGRPALPISSLSSILNLTANFRASSSIIGYGNDGCSVNVINNELDFDLILFKSG